MKLSQYVEQIEIDSKNYLYNYFSGSFIEISDQSVVNKLKNDISSIPNEYLSILKEEGFVVCNELDEFNELKFTNWAAKFDPTALGITKLYSLM